MSERIVTSPERLRRPSAPVEFDAKARFLARRLLTAATASRRVRGVAAPQIGVHQRMFHWSFAGLPDVDGGRPVDRGGLPSGGIACNPTLLESSDETWTREEGCLSFPRKFIIVERPLTAHFEWFTVEGERREVTLGGYAARIWLHEADHLDGVLYMDRAPAKPVVFDL